ncbi:phosphate ABC transporter, inner membrane subunit PstA [Caldicellulosiruptor saccharolyticus DSM 8903]|uniref:Phosphate ABC transporter, inner membrane subunit PstA n=1 Tax=Caldicellulosiruptor saccharolyticus (strain ATCC 43494 / DSM 8903 / Tp8T 6331) TaxID=351627 RepID=A4XJW9_CALS8|nr:phosphate ABC transporter permease PstA [Caldicellulosiruptor saccharolyticus]ABP67204.1 phosphate ABC transporter, inner membrane subunit PstA [Caldicellulosiruptor saccharolyticus DSM 8903]
MIKKNKIIQGIVFTIIGIFTLITIAILLAILFHIVVNGIQGIKLSFITEYPEEMGKSGGIFPVIVGTIYITVLAVVIAAPIGVLAAIYLTEYAKKGKVLSLIRFGTETLAGIPSIIYGLFGFAFFVIALGFRWSILSGALTLSIMILPTIVRTSEEAIKTVPMSFREGSLALGATKWQTIAKVVIPPAMPGILTGVILGVGRAIGETAAVLLTAGSSLNLPTSIFSPARTMAVHLYILSSEGLSKVNSYATATLLIIIVLIINTCANMIIRRYNKILGH